MKIQEQDLFHGPPLMQIVEDRRFTALNKPFREYGHYLINHDRQIFVKYSGSVGPTFQFTFSPSEVRDISRYSRRKGRLFVVLTCGRKSICPLSKSELWEVIDRSNRSQQWVRVHARAGGSMWVSGSRGDLPHSIPHNSFPGKILR